MSLTYVGAAFEVLGRHGKPMHYETICSTAISLGLLETRARYPEVVFSSTLSRYASANDETPFRKARPGVYELQRRFSIDDIGVSPHCAQKVERIVEQIGTDHNYIEIVQKSLFLLRNAIELVKNNWSVLIGSDQKPFRLRPISDHYEEIIFGAKPLRVELDLIRAAAGLRLRLEAKELLHVFLVALSLLEFCIVEEDGGEVMLEGDKGARVVRLFG